MEKVSLFEHNEIAYRKLVESLKTNKATTINHATGTGKSFIALKYLYENRDKKYLYIAPTYPIIDQLLESCYKIGITPKKINIDTMIYRNLLEMNMEELYQKYDGFIFDEYHRTGAKETYKKIKELKLLLKQSNDEKKFIGLTATPIRYLDKERNMTQEIFDGNVASSLSLSESMLEGLLPTPIYINSKIACRPILNSIKLKADKMFPCKQKTKLIERINEVDKRINNGILDNKELVNKYITEENGKYIIFCNDIDELDKVYEQIDKWFENKGPIKKYKVHSRITIEKEEKKEVKNIRDKNRKTLESFNKDKKGISLLLCVDILNEGVHVDEIDGIFMLRKTKSPIIYFQQIGRALSFSGRNKQIKIFDLVNNFNNHMAIDMLYEELHEEFERKIKENPENKEKYENNLQKFRIMDETKSILKSLTEIKNQITREKIIESKIDYSIEILEEYVRNGNNVLDIFQNQNAKNAFMIITRYDIYVNNEQFEKLTKLNIALPEKIFMTTDERKEQLKGYNSFYEQLKLDNDKSIIDVIDFIKSANRLPNVNSENEEERNLAQRYLNGINYFEKEKIEELKQICKYYNIELNAWEKIVFDEKIDVNDLQQVLYLSKGFLENEEEIPNYLQETIKKIITKYDIKENTKLFELLEKSEKIKQNQLEQSQKIRYEILNKVQTYLQEHIDDNQDELDKSGIMDVLKKLKVADIKYIKNKYMYMKKEKLSTYFEDIGNESLTSFCKKMRYIKKEQFNEAYENIEQNNKINDFIIKLIRFVNNNGRYPIIDSKDEEESNLAKEYRIIEKSKQTENIFRLLEEDKDSKLYNPKILIYEQAIKNKEENEIKSVILRFLEFFNTNGRKALPNSNDEQEKTLAIEYREKCVNVLQSTQIEILNRIFNNRKNFRKSCSEYIKNIKLNQER